MRTATRHPCWPVLPSAGLAFALSYALIRWLGEEFMRVGFKGRDMGKGRAGGSVEMCVCRSFHRVRGTGSFVDG